MVWWLCFVVIYGPIGFPDNWRPFPFCNLSCTILNLLCSRKIFDNIWKYLKYLHANYLALSLREDVPKKAAEGGRGGPCPNFLSPFYSVHFWSIKGVPFLQNANNLNFKLFFYVVYMPHKASILPLFEKNFG